MSDPFSDTTTPNQQLQSEWTQAKALAARIGLPEGSFRHPGHFSSLLFTAMHKVLDRLEVMEGGSKPSS